MPSCARKTVVDQDEVGACHVRAFGVGVGETAALGAGIHSYS